MESVTKLQEITQKLYEEGLSKGKAEGEFLLAQAEKQAALCRQEAQAYASELKARTEAACEKRKQNVEQELKRTSIQMLSGLKKDIENRLLAETIDVDVHTSFESSEFIQKMVLEAIQSFAVAEKGAENLGGASNQMEWEILWPQTKRKEWEEQFKRQVEKILKNGIKVCFTRNIACGFQLQSHSKGYKLGFTEEDFKALFRAYARDQMHTWLFPSSGKEPQIEV